MVWKTKKQEVPQSQEQDSEESEEFQEPIESEEPEVEQAKEAKPEDKKELTVDDVLINHEERLKILESKFFRLQNI